MSKVKISNRERGIALIFTLSMLALLMILMMAFVASMLIKRRVSENMAARSQADLLVDSAVAQAELQMWAIMNNIGNKTKAYNFDQVASRSSNKAIDPNDTKGIATAMNVKYSGSTEYMYESPENDTAIKGNPHWLYIYDDLSATPGKPIGRFAYATVPNRPLADYLAVVGKPLSIGQSESADGDGEVRLGRGLSDLDLNVLQAGVTDTKPDYTALHNRSQLLALNGKSSSDSEKGNFDRYLIFNTPSAAEVFRSKGDFSKASLYRRYDLSKIKNLEGTSTSPSTSPTERVEKLLKDDWDKIQYYDTEKGTTNSDAADSLRFFDKFEHTSKDEHTFPNDEAWRNQIAANMIDYVMKYDTPTTSDIEPDKWSNSAPPSYTGNKRVPYINEIGGQLIIEVKVVGTRLPPPSTTIEYELSIDKIIFRPAIELVDIYGIDTAKDFNCEIFASLNFKITINSSEFPITGDYSIPKFKITSASKVASNTKDGYLVQDTEYKISPPSGTITSRDSYFKIKMDDPKIKITAVKLSREDPAFGVDFAMPGDDKYGAFTPQQYTITPQGVGTKEYYYVYDFSIEANDPRQNLNAKDWTAQEVQANFYNKKPENLSSTASTFGQPNKSIKRSGSYDAEPAVNNKNIAASAEDTPRISTAYIREDDYQSLHELGFIHRGIAWQTLNLSNAQGDDLESASYPNNYIQGDAEILDMVFLGNTTKIDLNATEGRTNEPYNSNNKLWQALFSNSNNSSDHKMLASGNIIANKELSDGTNFTNSLNIISQLNNNPSWGELLYKDQLFRRSAIASVLVTRADLPDTDAGKEALIGRIANITEAGQFPAVIQLVVVAQTLRPEAVVANYNESEEAWIVSQVPENAIASYNKKLVTIMRDVQKDGFVVVDIQDLN